MTDILSLTVPAGWKLVPIEPTEDMRRAAFDAVEWVPSVEFPTGTAARNAVYAAMLSVAPTPPAAEAPGQEPVAVALASDRVVILTRPIIGIENRTAQEAFDIMADRIRSALVSAPPTYADAEAKLRPMSEARKHGKEVVVATSNRAGLDGYLIAHWASDISGSEQPPFEGWFYWTGHGFREIPEAELLGWCELPPIRSLASPAPKE